MATLVTGGTGFIGVNLVRALARAGHQVVSLDLNPPDKLVRDFLAREAHQVTFVQGDILDPAGLERLVPAYFIDKVVHAAVFTGIRPDIEASQGGQMADINLSGTVNLLELARLLGPVRFVYVSSRAVYGPVTPPGGVLHEDTPVSPANLYGITKYASELLTRRYGEVHGFSTASVRLSSPYGPMERVTGHRAVMSVFRNWTDRVGRGEPIQEVDLASGRDYTYVTDAVEGIRAVLDAPELGHGVYNVGTGIWLTGADILFQLKKLSPNLSTVNVPEKEEGTGFLATSGETTPRPMDVQRIWKDLGWTTSYDLAAGLAHYLRWRHEAEFLD